MPKAYRHMLAPVVEYITSGDAWDEQELIEHFNEVTTVKVTEPSVTATLIRKNMSCFATSVEK